MVSPRCEHDESLHWGNRGMQRGGGFEFVEVSESKLEIVVVDGMEYELASHVRGQGDSMASGLFESEPCKLGIGVAQRLERGELSWRVGERRTRTLKRRGKALRQSLWSKMAH